MWQPPGLQEAVSKSTCSYIERYERLAWSAARREHAFNLRREGLTWAVIGGKLGVKGNIAKEMAWTFALRSGRRTELDEVDDAIERRRSDYVDARLEHAFLLRCEGLAFFEVARRIGVSTPKARWFVERFGRSLGLALRETQFSIYESAND